jgi:hypothetical protein
VPHEVHQHLWGQKLYTIQKLKVTKLEYNKLMSKKCGLLLLLGFLSLHYYKQPTTHLYTLGHASTFAETLAELVMNKQPNN